MNCELDELQEMCRQKESAVQLRVALVSYARAVTVRVTPQLNTRAGTEKISCRAAGSRQQKAAASDSTLRLTL